MQMGSTDVCYDVGGGVQGDSDAAVTLLTPVECSVTIPKNKENVIKIWLKEPIKWETYFDLNLRRKP